MNKKPLVIINKNLIINQYNFHSHNTQCPKFISDLINMNTTFETQFKMKYIIILQFVSRIVNNEDINKLI